MSDTGSRFARFAAVFAGGTLFSRVLGLVRDLAIAALIPRGARDVFIFAFRLPNMLRDLVGEGAMNAAFMPVLTATREKEGDEGFERLIAALFGAMMLLLSVLTLAGILAMPAIASLLDGLAQFTTEDAMNPADQAQLILAAQWAFPYLLFIGLAVFCMGPLFVTRHYATPAWSPALLNVALLIGVAMRDAFPEPAYALIAGVWLGGVAQLLVLYSAMGRRCGVWLPRSPWSHPGVKRALLLMVPVLFGQAAGEVNKLVDTLFAATLETGTVFQLFCANRLVQLPLSVFGMAMAVAILPDAARAATRGDFSELRANIMRGMRQLSFLVVPSMLGLIVLREPIVRLLFERGEFTALDTTRTANALGIYAAGLLGFALVKVLAQGFFAMQDTRTPVIISASSMLLNIALNFALVGPLGYMGLALATTISFTLNAVLLFTFLGMRVNRLWDGPMASSLAKTVVASTLAMVAAWGVHRVLEGVIGHEALAARAALVMGPIACAVIIFAAVAAMTRSTEFADFTTMLRRRARK